MKSPFPSGPEAPRVVRGIAIRGMRFEEIEYPPGLLVPLHSHADLFLDYCVSGTIQERWPRSTFSRGPQTLNYLPQGAPHGTYFRESARTFQIVLKGDWLSGLAPSRHPAAGAACHENVLPNWMIARLYREFVNPDEVTSLVLEGGVLELLAQLSRESRPPDGRECPHWLGRVRDYLHAHFRDPLSVADLAAAVDVHPSHLMRAFRQHHRCTVGTYVRRLRVEYAAHLLRTSATSLTEIALEAGFAEQSHFTRTFRTISGMSPSEFRRRSDARIPPPVG